MRHILFSSGMERLTFTFGNREAILTALPGTPQIELDYRSAFGTGERFDTIDLYGHSINHTVVEQFCYQGDKTYCPIPFFFTDTGFGLYAAAEQPTRFTFGSTIELNLPEGIDLYLFEGTPDVIISEFIELTGKAAVPPKWAFGPWISANSWQTEAEVREQLALLDEHGYPATVTVMEAWSDEETFYIFNGADYPDRPAGVSYRYEDFDFSGSAYWDNPKQLIEDMADRGMRLILWQIPAYKAVDEETGNRQKQDLDYAASHGLVLKQADGSPYRIPDGNWFEGSMLPDFSNEETRRHWFGNRQYLLDIGIAGFKTDGGEFIYQNEVYANDGKDGSRLRNTYAQCYVSAYREFAGSNRALFSRAGYIGQQTTPILWAGDQKSDNSELQSVLKAGLSAGLSGIPFWGFDIGGFSGPMPTVDLYRRATQMACFAPVMQWHSETAGGQYGGEGSKERNERSPWYVAEVNGEPGLIEELRFWHRLRMNLLPYIYDQANRCATESRPMMRALIYEWPADEAAADCHDEYLFGDSLLVAPVLEENQTERAVYLPEGEWYSLYDGKACSVGRHLLPCERIQVFLRGGRAVGLNLADSGELGSDVGSRTDYAELTLWLVGPEGRDRFADDLGNDLLITWKNGEYKIEGSLATGLRVRLIG